MVEPCDLSAREARRLIGGKRLSPVELLESCLERIEAANPELNTVVALDRERARAAAAAAEAAAARGEPLGPLHGLPVAVKDLSDTQGLVTTYGSRFYRDHVPAADDRLVAALREAGAVVLGKTNTPEFGAGAHTVNDVYGATGNPFDPARTCGGSSGGSAVAVATGMAPLATGSDTGGSLRIPAAFCGVVGYRPSPGLVPSGRRVVGYTTFAVEGPIARSVDDAALMLSALAGEDRCDPLSGPIDRAGLAAPPPVDPSALRVAVSEDLGFAPLDGGIRRTFRRSVERLRGIFAECREAAPDFGPVDRTFWILRGVHFVACYGEHYARHRERLGANVASNVAAGLALTAEEIAWAQAEQTRLYRRFHRFFEEVDLLLCPTTAVPPFPLDRPYCDEIDGRKMDSYIAWVAITYALTLSGAAVCVLPCGRDPTGTPFGVQLVAPRGADRFLLGAATALERLFAADPELARPIPPVAAG